MSIVAALSPGVTWAVVVVVLLVVLLFLVAPDVLRKVRAREIRVRSTGEGATRRRAGAELHAPHFPDWEARGWFGADDEVVPSMDRGCAPREAARTSSVTTTRSAA